MVSKANYDNLQILNKSKQSFECKFHNKKYIAYCSKCKMNICEKCLMHNSHKIYHYKRLYLSENQTKYYQALFYLCKYYLKRVREIVVELLYELSEIIKNESKPKDRDIIINLRSQLKNTYKFFYTMNTYQKTYSRFILNLYFECKKIGIINCQVINNIYNIKMNSVKIPELDNKDTIVKAHIMIEFMKNTKSNNNILKSSDSKHPNIFYSYIDYDNSQNSKVKIYTTNLNNIKYNNEIEELLVPIQNKNIENNENNDINRINNSNSNSDTEDTEGIIENENNIINTTNISNELIIINNSYEDEKKETNKQGKDDKNNQSKENISASKFKAPSIKQGSEELNNNNNKNSINIEKEKNQSNTDKTYSNELLINKKVEENNSTIKKNKNEEIQDDGYKEIRREVNPNERIKNYIFTSLPEVCQEEVEYRDDIKFEYIDHKNNNKKINCSYYGEFKKGTLKRHGRGLFIFSDGEFYMGYWANDKREGKGTNTYSNGNIYSGEYKNGKKDGQGEYKWNNGDMYKGSWKNDMMDGKGVYTYSNGDIFDGYFKMDKIDREKEYKRSNKNNFKGQIGYKFINKSGTYEYTINNNDTKNKSEQKINIKDIKK